MRICLSNYSQIQKANYLAVKRRSYQSGQRTGFTLIELLLVAAIFSTVSLVATTVFVNIQTYQRGILSRQRVVADGRYILEAIARSIRVGTIDYDYYFSKDPTPYCSNDNGETCLDSDKGLRKDLKILAVRDQENNQTCYRLYNYKLEITDKCSSATPNWTSITPDDLSVEQLRFYVTPVSDPYRLVRSEDDCYETAIFNTQAGACACTIASNCFYDQVCQSTGATKPGEPTKICVNPNIQPTVTIYLETRSNNTAPGENARIQLQTTVVSRVYRR